MNNNLPAAVNEAIEAKYPKHVEGAEKNFVSTWGDIRDSMVEAAKQGAQLALDTISNWAVQDGEGLMDAFLGLLYKNVTDGGDDGRWINSNDFHEVAATCHNLHLQATVQKDEMLKKMAQALQKCITTMNSYGIVTGDNQMAMMANYEGKEIITQYNRQSNG